MSLRRCLREPLSEIKIAAGRLRDAVAHSRGNLTSAASLLRRNDDKVLRHWPNSVSGKETEYDSPRHVVAEPSARPMKGRSKPHDLAKHHLAAGRP